MNVWVIVSLAAALFLFVRWSMRREAEARQVLRKLWLKLDAEVLEVSQLVSQKCPNDELAHRLVAEAALHRQLFYQPVYSRMVVSTGLLAERFGEGFAFLEKARKLAAGSPVEGSFKSETNSALCEELVQKYLLVSAKCPTNVEAHRLIIEAAEYTSLPYEPVLARVIVTQSMYDARYARCRELLRRVEELAAAG